ncbi:hypothetical protein HK102_010159, partial [Quaeritorhiza haematococci]
MPCWIIYWSAAIGIPLWYFCLAGRGTRLLYLYRIQELIYKNRNNTTSSILSASSASSTTLVEEGGVVVMTAVDIDEDDNEVKVYQHPQQPLCCKREGIMETFRTLIRNTQTSIYKSPFLASEYKFAVIALLPMIPFFVLAGSIHISQAIDLIRDPQRPGTSRMIIGDGTCGVMTPTEQWPLILAICLACSKIPISSWLLWSLRNIKDANQIKIDVCISLILCAVGGGTTVLILIIPSAFSSYHILGPTTIVALVLVFCHFLLIIFPLVQSYREEAVRKQMGQEIKLSMGSFREVLKGGEAFERFKMFCVRDFCIEAAKFYEDHRALLAQVSLELSRLHSRSSCDSSNTASTTSTTTPTTTNSPTLPDPSSPSTNNNDFVPLILIPAYESLYTLYIQSSAPLELNIPFHMKKKLDAVFAERVGAGESGRRKGMELGSGDGIRVDMFEEVVAHVVEMM